MRRPSRPTARRLFERRVASWARHVRGDVADRQRARNNRGARAHPTPNGWGARIRTWDHGTKTRCLTTWPRPNRRRRHALRSCGARSIVGASAPRLSREERGPRVGRRQKIGALHGGRNRRPARFRTGHRRATVRKMAPDVVWLTVEGRGQRHDGSPRVVEHRRHHAGSAPGRRGGGRGRRHAARSVAQPAHQICQHHGAEGARRERGSARGRARRGRGASAAVGRRPVGAADA